MNKDHLNLFCPYSSGPEHENNLTRGLLLILKSSPFLFRQFINLILRNYSSSELITLSQSATYDIYNEIKEVKFYTQTKKDLSEDACEVNLPVLITKEKVENIPLPKRIEKERQPDGIICLKPNLSLTIEVKKHNNFDWSQVYGHIQVFGDDVSLHKAINITWDEIIRLFKNSFKFYEQVYNREGCVSGIEKTLVQDFIDYLTLYHPQLMPYNSLKECRDNQIAYRKYFINILEDLSIGEAVAEKSPYILINDSRINKFVQRIYLKVDKKEENLIIACYPADTTGQAKEFYRIISEEKISKIVTKGWSLDTALHFNYIGTQLVHANSDNEGAKDPIDYIKYWIKAYQNEEIKQFQENEFEVLIEKLINDKMISKQEKNEIKKEFIDTNRDHINLAPGVKLSYEIPMEKALKWDEEDNLVSKIEEISNDILNL